MRKKRGEKKAEQRRDGKSNRREFAESSESSLNADNSSIPLSQTLRSDWLTVAVSCLVCGRDGAVDFQVQSGGHGGLLPADLRPRAERTDRRCQVKATPVCSHFLPSVLLPPPPPHLFPSGSAFAACAFISPPGLFSLLPCVSNDQFLHTCSSSGGKTHLKLCICPPNQGLVFDAHACALDSRSS